MPLLDWVLPIADKSWIIAEYLENWYDIKDGQAYIVLTLDDGIVFKLATNKLKKKGILEIISLNDDYAPYEVHVSEIKEIWKFCNYISNEMPDSTMQKSKLLNKLQLLGEQIVEIREGLS